MSGAPFRAGRDLSLALALLASACSLPPGRVSPPPERLAQTGIASWYGPGFHGRPTASGAVYDQNQLSAAHPTLPLGTRVLVTNLENGRSVEVTINDRGPFVRGRTIDLSHRAAQAIGLIAPGTAPVRIEVLEAPVELNRIPPSLDYTLQVGSFTVLENAQSAGARLAPRHAAPEEISIVPFLSGGTLYYRVQIGTFSDRAAAEERARRMAASGLPVMVVEK
jgi:rare lipoprotein A